MIFIMFLWNSLNSYFQNMAKKTVTFDIYKNIHNMYIHFQIFYAIRTVNDSFLAVFLPSFYTDSIVLSKVPSGFSYLLQMYHFQEKTPDII
jgi:hypothetical protein